MTAVGRVEVIPARYILPRWLVLPPDIIIPHTEPQQMPPSKLSKKEMKLLRYGNLCTDFTKLALAGSASEKTDEVAHKHMRAMQAEFEAMKKEAVDALCRKKNKKAQIPTSTDNEDTGNGDDGVPGRSTVDGNHADHE
jgi:hypothetical protein